MTDLRQRVEALEPTRSYPYDGGYYDSGYRDAIADVLALLDGAEGELNLSTSMTVLCYRLAEKEHYGQHHAWNKLDFDDCRHGFCGQWHELQEKATTHTTTRGEA